MDDLRPISGVDASALRWTRIGEGGRAFELRSGDVPVARLLFPHATGSLAHATLAGRTLTLKRGGFLAPHVTVRSEPDGATVARLAVHLNGSVLDVGRDRTYRLHRSGLLVPAWKVTDLAGTTLVDLEPVAEGRHLAGAVATTSPLAREAPELGVLLVVVWYFVVLAWFEDEAVAASKSALTAVMGA